MHNKFNFKNCLVHPPLYFSKLGGARVSSWGRPVFEGKNCRHDTTMVIPNWFRNLFTAGTHKHEMLKRYKMNQRGTSCANLYAVAVQHDKLYNAPHCKSKKCAFTLAEVLITLVIIGVVAALTIPNLMQKYTEQTTVKKVQKFYSNLSNAYSLAKKENGLSDEWGLTGYDEDSAVIIYNLLIKPYFKIAKDCGFDKTGNCVGKRHKALNNTPHTNYGTNTGYYKIALDGEGSLVLRGSRIMYDINGLNAPNQWGKDTFCFDVRTDKIIPCGAPGSTGKSYSFDTNCNTQNSGIYCAGWVVYKGNMDYLHCDDLSWTGKDKCK